MQNETCAICGKSLVDACDFCPSCGARRVSPSTEIAIDAYVRSRISSELSSRLADQKNLVREIGDQAEEVVWKRLKNYGVLFGIILSLLVGFLSFEGLKTIGDVQRRIEPTVNAAEQRAQAAKRTVEEVGTKVDSVKVSLDQLSRDVESQTRRVAERGGEISQKLAGLDTVAKSAQERGQAYQARSEDLSRSLEASAKALERRVDQVSKQVDNLSVRQVYPTLGQELFVTFAGARWKGAAGKAPGEKWINISIFPRAVGDVSADQMERLLAELKSSNFTPLLGMFGVGGPYYSGLTSLGDSDETSVFYWRKPSEQMATTVSAMASRILSINDVKPRFFDASGISKREPLRFIIDESGLDLQLIILPRK